MRALFSIVALFIGCGLASLSLTVAREPWTNSRVFGSPEPPKPYAVERVYPGLQFTQPVELLPLGDSGRMLLLEVGGQVFTFKDDPDCTQADLAIDLVPRIDSFSRAYGIGVHPNFDANRTIFVCYAGDPVARPDGTRLSRFRMTTESPPRIDPDSEEILLTWASGGHNGCAIRFDSQGYLYFSAGDGARPYPPDEYDVSQDLSDLRATICRIDVDHRAGELAYAIPKDNPFIDTRHARPEIWAYGFRNPWRFTIDNASGKIFCGDVGWELWELIHDVRRGGNHGWSIFEGPQPIRSDITPGPTPIIKPLVAYPHTEGLSVTGGVVYHGDALPELSGAYLYGDFVTGLLWGVRAKDEDETIGKTVVNAASQVEWNQLLAETGLKIITMTEARDGEVLVVSYDGGIYRLVKNQLADQSSQFPRLLSQTGLFKDTARLQLASGVLPYTLTAPASQSEMKIDFAVGVPSTETITINRQQRNWKYPVGTVFSKTLFMPGPSTTETDNRKIETQLLHFDGLAWQPYTYAWNAEQSDAELVAAEGASADLQLSDANRSPNQPTSWRFASRGECRACHSNQAGGAVAFILANLASLDHQRVDDPLSALVTCGLVEQDSNNHWPVERMVDPTDASAALESRARSYLAANCAHCHCRGGGGTVALDLSFSIPTSDIFAIDFPATQGTFEIPAAKVIVPGNPYRSVLYYRMATCGTGHMPKLWTRDNDSLGLNLIHDWIKSLDDSSENVIESNVEQISDVSSALQWLHQLEQTTDGDARRQHALQALATADPLTRGLVERFLPDAERVQRLGSDIDVNYFLAATGDAARGRERFLNSKTQQCRTCHRLAEQGRAIGPDLDGIAKKRSRAELLESILDPSKKIEPEFATQAVVTVDGQVINGLRIEQTSSGVVIRSADGQDHQLTNEDIEHTSTQTQSLMPVGLATEMTTEELSDLLEFLCSLK